MPNIYNNKQAINKTFRNPGNQKSEIIDDQKIQQYLQLNCKKGGQLEKSPEGVSSISLAVNMNLADIDKSLVCSGPVSNFSYDSHIVTR